MFDMGKPRKIITDLENSRVETGGVQFNDDWPGLFIRGDNCAALLIEINYVFQELEHNKIEISPFAIGALKGLSSMIQTEVLNQSSVGSDDGTT